MTQEKRHRLIGIACALGAFCMLSLMSAIAKILGETHHPVEIAFYRNLVGTLLFLVWIFGFSRLDILQINKNPKGIVGRSVLGTVSLAITFAAFIAMPMADVTAFLFTSSLFLPIMCYFFLSEKVGPYRIGAIIVGFAGVMIMLAPTGETMNMIGVGLAMTAAIMHASLQTILRGLGKTEKPETVTFYFVMIGTVLAAIPLPFIATPPGMSEIPLLFAIGVVGTAGQMFLSTAFKYAEAAIVSVCNYTGIIWATLLGWMIWNDWPTTQIFVGAGVVIAANIFIIWRESIRSEEEPVHARGKF